MPLHQAVVPPALELAEGGVEEGKKTRLNETKGESKQNSDPSLVMPMPSQSAIFVLHCFFLLLPQAGQIPPYFSFRRIEVRSRHSRHS
jgi:hypothetical protein